MIDGAKQFITNAGTDISGMVASPRSPARDGAGSGDREISNIIVGQRNRRATSRASPTARWAGTPRIPAR